MERVELEVHAEHSGSWLIMYLKLGREVSSRAW